MPNFLLSLRRELGQLRGLLAVQDEPIPDSITVQLFGDDDPGLYRQYVDDLGVWLDAHDATGSIVVTVDVRGHRPPGLRPPWLPPRPWLDYRPSQEELSRLRPDLAGSPAPRVDWTPAPTPAPTPRATPTSEHEERIASARERWIEQQRRDGTGDAIRDVRNSLDDADTNTRATAANNSTGACHLGAGCSCHLGEDSGAIPALPKGRPLSLLDSAAIDDDAALPLAGGRHRIPDADTSGPLGAA